MTRLQKCLSRIGARKAYFFISDLLMFFTFSGSIVHIASLAPTNLSRRDRIMPMMLIKFMFMFLFRVQNYTILCIQQN